MKRISVFLIVCLVALATQASAEVMHYSKCKLNEGKTIADVQAWVKDWRALKTAEGIDYRVRLLVPHADTTMRPGEFFIEGGSSTLQSHAAAFDWWYTSDKAAKSGEQLNAAASCDSGAIYRSTD